MLQIRSTFDIPQYQQFDLFLEPSMELLELNNSKNLAQSLRELNNQSVFIGLLNANYKDVEKA